MRATRAIILCTVLASVVLADVSSSTRAGAQTAGSKFVAVTPSRILDSRPGAVPDDGVDGPIGVTSSVFVTVAGRGGVPRSGATAVVLNVTVTEAAGVGFVQVAP